MRVKSYSKCKEQDELQRNQGSFAEGSSYRVSAVVAVTVVCFMNFSSIRNDSGQMEPSNFVEPERFSHSKPEP